MPVGATFRNAAGQLVDPATVTCEYKKPDGTVTTLVYGQDAAVVKDSTGVYHADLNANVSGTWYYRWSSTGPNQAADESRFSVGISEF